MGKIIWTIIVCVVAFWLMTEKQEGFNWGKYVICSVTSICWGYTVLLEKFN